MLHKQEPVRRPWADAIQTDKEMTMPKPQKLTLYDGYAVLTRVAATACLANSARPLTPVKLEISMFTDKMPATIADWAMGEGVHVAIIITGKDND